MDLQNTSTALFNKLRGQFPTITVGDSDGNVTNNPKQARFFDFDFVKEGKSFGKISISISEDQGLVVLHSTDVISEADPATKESWYNFLKEMREFAKARLMGFDTRDITKSNLEKRDYEFLKKENNMEAVSESNMFGTNKTSFQQIGDAKMVVKHSTIVDPEIPGARSQKIESIFIESPAGERFKFPLKHLNGARAMTRHVAEGGNPYDQFGKYILGLSEELNKLKKFKTYMNRSNVMAEGLKEYLSVIDERIEDIKHTAQKLQKESGYKSIKETHEESVLEEVPANVQKNWIDELTIKTFNEELQDVFPYIYKLVSERTAIKELRPQDFETEAHGYQGGAESRTIRVDMSGDFDPESPVSDKEAEEVTQELAKAGIVADVQPDENRHNGVVIHTDANPEAVKDALGSMIETLNTFEDFEKEINLIVGEEENGLFASDKTESEQAIVKLNKLMAKHFPAGPNGVNGIESLQGIIDDEDLNAQIKMASKEDADACLRPMIMDYIKSKNPQMISKIDTGDMKTEEKGKSSGVEITPELKEKVQAWWDKWSKYQGGNSNTMAEGYLQYRLNSGIGHDFFNADEVIALKKKYGEDFDDSAHMDEMPLTRQCEDEIQAITGKDSEDAANIVQDVVKHFVEKEAITFEDIKPYVSMYKGKDGKIVHDILDKDGKSVTTFNNAKEAIDFLSKNFDKLRNKDVKEKTTAHDLDTDYEGSFEYELPGDDGEMAYGKIHYKAINGKVDPNSLRGEYTYDGNHKVDDDFANEMIKPGGPEHEEALKAAQEDYDYESDRMRSKFGMEDQEEKSFKDKEQTVEDFVKSFFDYTSNQFPKGETAVLTSVEKKFGDNAVRTAQETIQNLMANKDPEIAKIKKLAGI
jgi:hypothetical protein